MEYLFYIPEDGLKEKGRVRITGQEAQHIHRVLRHQPGDEILTGDGNGTHFRCRITETSKKEIQAEILEKEYVSPPESKKVAALGTIKKRDRLEFAVEKATELGVWEICLFDADHSERSRINEQRLRAVILSAFKQSKRFWLPTLRIVNSLGEVLAAYPNHETLMAHQHPAAVKEVTLKDSKDLLLLTGPEGGFSEREVELATSKEAKLYSLGSHRLRAETALVALLSRFIH